MGSEEGRGGLPWRPAQGTGAGGFREQQGRDPAWAGVGGREVSEGSDHGGGGQGGPEGYCSLGLGLWQALLHSHPVWQSANGPGAVAGVLPGTPACVYTRQSLEQGPALPRRRAVCCPVVSGTLGGLPLLRPPCRGGEGRDSSSLADATRRGSGHPLLPTGIFRSLHRCSPDTRTQALGGGLRLPLPSTSLNAICSQHDSAPNVSTLGHLPSIPVRPLTRQ